MKLQIPKIDYKILCDQGDKRYKSELEKLKLAITDFGFLILQNHPITDKKINNTFSIYKEFFNLPFKQKNEINMSNTMSNRGWGATKSEQVSQNYNPDYKEIFDCGPSIKVNHQFKEMSYYSNNIWPKGIPDFESIVTSFYDSCNEIATSLLKNIEVSFNYSNNYFANKFNFPMALLRCNYYSARSSKLSKKDFGVAPHTDYGCLTLLFTDGTEGLEIQRPSNKWLKVVAPKHEIIVNFGEMLEIWSRNKIKATTHKVVGTDKARYSIPFFFNPQYDTIISDELNIVAGEYLSKRYDTTYTHKINLTN